MTKYHYDFISLGTITFFFFHFPNFLNFVFLLENIKIIRFWLVGCKKHCIVKTKLTKTTDFVAALPLLKNIYPMVVVVVLIISEPPLDIFMMPWNIHNFFDLQVRLIKWISRFSLFNNDSSARDRFYMGREFFCPPRTKIDQTPNS